MHSDIRWERENSSREHRCPICECLYFQSKWHLPTILNGFNINLFL